MDLPILQPASQANRQTLVRLFHQTQLNWCRHLAEEDVLDLGTALFNAQLPNVPEANLIMDAALPNGIPAADAIALAIEFYREKGSALAGLIHSPSASPDSTRQLSDHLSAIGWTPHERAILRLARRPAASPLQIPPDIKIIPARASFRHAQQLAEEIAEQNRQQSQAALMHLDDPHVDALLALRDGQAIAAISVLAMGEIGRIDQLFVSPPFRRAGLGKLMLSRAVEICARALFKHVLLSVGKDQLTAQALFTNFGFEKIGEMTLFVRSGRDEGVKG